MVSAVSVDRPGHRLRALAGHRPLGYFDALHLRRVQLVQSESWWCGIAIDQDQGVTGAQPPHARLVALHGDTGQALQHIGQVGVAVAVELITTIDLLGDLGASAQFVVAGLLAQDLDPFEPTTGRARAGLTRSGGDFLAGDRRHQGASGHSNHQRGVNESGHGGLPLEFFGDGNATVPRVAPWRAGLERTTHTSAAPTVAVRPSQWSATRAT